VHFDLEKLAFQVFQEEIILDGFNGAQFDTASTDDFDPDSVLWIMPSLPIGNSLPVTDAIVELNVSRNLISMTTKFF